MNNQEKAHILKTLSACTEEQFDGHTEFARLSPLERLQWLSQSVYFVHTVAKTNQHLGCNRFFNKPVDNFEIKNSTISKRRARD